MNVLGISGSPRKRGNTTYAVKYALDFLKKEGFKTRFISLANKKIQPCTGCWKCEKDYSCWIEDSMNEILLSMRWADGIIIGSPVYFGLVSGQLKTMMDRTIVLRPNYGDPLPLSGKIGGGIACGASRNGGQELTLQNIQTYFLQMNMKVISDGPNFCHSGATLFKDAKEDVWGLETVKNLVLHQGTVVTEL